MVDDINPPQMEVVFEPIGDTPSKSKRLNYEKIKELCTEAQSLRTELHKSQAKEIRDRLDTFIEELHDIRKSTSKYLDSDEVISDIGWIVEYTRKEEWNSVARWLSNIDSSLREMWSQYIQQIIERKNIEKEHKNER